jgi:hypothetical protein
MNDLLRTAAQNLLNANRVLVASRGDDRNSAIAAVEIAERDLLAVLATQPRYLIWSNEHQAWWRANSDGYTIDVDQAGRYPRDRAIEIASGARDGWFHGVAPSEIAIAESDVLAHKRQPAPTRKTASA